MRNAGGVSARPGQPEQSEQGAARCLGSVGHVRLGGDDGAAAGEVETVKERMQLWNLHLFIVLCLFPSQVLRVQTRLGAARIELESSTRATTTTTAASASAVAAAAGAMVTLRSIRGIDDGTAALLSSSSSSSTDGQGLLARGASASVRAKMIRL